MLSIRGAVKNASLMPVWTGPNKINNGNRILLVPSIQLVFCLLYLTKPPVCMIWYVWYFYEKFTIFFFIVSVVWNHCARLGCEKGAPGERQVSVADGGWCWSGRSCKYLTSYYLLPKQSCWNSKIRTGRFRMSTIMMLYTQRLKSFSKYSPLSIGGVDIYDHPFLFK